MEYYTSLPPAPKGEITYLIGSIGWGVPLGNEGSEASKNLFNMFCKQRIWFLKQM